MVGCEHISLPNGLQPLKAEQEWFILNLTHIQVVGKIEMKINEIAYVKPLCIMQILRKLQFLLDDFTHVHAHAHGVKKKSIIFPMNLSIHL